MSFIFKLIYFSTKYIRSVQRNKIGIKARILSLLLNSTKSLETEKSTFIFSTIQHYFTSNSTSDNMGTMFLWRIGEQYSAVVQEDEDAFTAYRVVETRTA